MFNDSTISMKFFFQRNLELLQLQTQFQMDSLKGLVQMYAADCCASKIELPVQGTCNVCGSYVVTFRNWM